MCGNLLFLASVSQNVDNRATSIHNKSQIDRFRKTLDLAKKTPQNSRKRQLVNTCVSTYVDAGIFWHFFGSPFFDNVEILFAEENHLQKTVFTKPV